MIHETNIMFETVFLTVRTKEIDEIERFYYMNAVDKMPRDCWIDCILFFLYDI
jgi:hypothetical protein